MTPDKPQEKEKPKLICSSCNKPFTPKAFGMIGESYIKCPCGAVFLFYDLTDWWERGVQRGKEIVRSSIKEALGI